MSYDQNQTRRFWCQNGIVYTLRMEQKNKQKKIQQYLTPN